MHILAIHDEQGNIKYLAVPGRGLAGEIHLTSQEGELVTPIEVADIGDNPMDEKVHQRLLDLIASHRIEVGTEHPKLIRK
jgi:hypothetical protein